SSAIVHCAQLLFLLRAYRPVHYDFWFFASSSSSSSVSRPPRRCPADLRRKATPRQTRAAVRLFALKCRCQAPALTCATFDTSVRPHPLQATRRPLVLSAPSF